MLSAAALFVSISIGFGEPARAGWPPPADATAEELKDPANWPNDPAYGYDVAEGKSGQWHHYSFIPDRAPNAPRLREGESAAGMSVDLAWRHSAGDDRVLVAVTDSGIEWDNPNLVNKAFLNKGELRGAPKEPLHADRSACAPLDPQQPSDDLFDCNGDGIFTVADYADHPDLLPEASDGHPQGDKNRNGVLDAGDLISNFSNDFDDDGNGYVDDISGWDFFKDDNDPYDDTGSGHGTREAEWSTAQGNDGIGEIGDCPLCRFVPLRVGDSFIAEVNDWAKAVVYATDLRAQMIQSALGTIDMSRFAQAALDYAWQNGTLVVSSMADENSRHHNMPAANNHTLPVHAVTMLMDGGVDANATAAQSFLAFNTCTNYGGQNYLSASGTACSGEAVGHLSGIGGLVHAIAFEAGLTPALTPGELVQVLLTSADDIDVGESREPESSHFWSQPGFDQRFGYGRVNANRALEAVRDGKIPPDIDVVRPRWFEVLYADRVSGPIPILGTVSAKRATSFDYTVEWAPGVQPLDSDFREIDSKSNVAGTAVAGEDGSPLAELEIRGLDVSHERDPDSPLGENDFTITVRVRALAHYGDPVGDVPGELRRTYYVHEDPDLLSGFPYRIGGSGESSPKLADIDGDGLRDIVLATADGAVHVLAIEDETPVPLPGFPVLVAPLRGFRQDPNEPSYRSARAYSDTNGIDPELAREAISATPAIDDIDGDGKPEIVVTTYQGSLYVIEHDGSIAAGWPVRLPDVPSCPLDGSEASGPCMDRDHIIARGAYASPVLADMNGDQKLDVVQAAFDGHVYVFDAAGEPLPNFPVLVRFPGTAGTELNRVMTTPAVADFNADGIPDLVVGSNEKLGGGAGAFYIIDGRGTAAGASPYLPNWPVTMTSFELFPLVGEGVPNSPVAADFDGDGVPEAVMHGNASAPLIAKSDPGPSSLGVSPPNVLLDPTNVFGADSKARLPDDMFPLFAQPSVGDLNQDGVPDVVASGGSLSMARDLSSSHPRAEPGQHLLAMWDGKTGAMFPGSPVLLEDFTFFNNHAIADLSGDGYPEVLTGSGGYYVHAADACGREPAGWPKFTGQWITATTAVGDIDGDELLDVVVPTRNGWLYAWRTQATADGVIQWESFHHDNRNTGHLGTPLPRGTMLGAAPPLPIDENGSCGTEETATPADARRRLEASGGCGCTLPARDPRNPAPLLVFAGLVSAWRRHLRRRLGS